MALWCDKHDPNSASVDLAPDREYNLTGDLWNGQDKEHTRRLENSRPDSSVGCLLRAIRGILGHAVLQAQNPQTKVSFGPSLHVRPIRLDIVFPPYLKPTISNLLSDRSRRATSATLW